MFREEISRPSRRTPAKGVHPQSGQPTIVWVTVCAKVRVPWVAKEPVQNALHDIWHRTATAWLVSDYLLMPDHLHFFCAPARPDFPIERWVAFWKDRFSRRCGDASWVWQRGVFHHRVRNEDEYQEKWTYVMQNPVRKGLVAAPDEWPYKGLYIRSAGDHAEIRRWQEFLASSISSSSSDPI